MLQQEVKLLLERRLEEKKMSQNELSKVLNVSGATISKILNEKWDSIHESKFIEIKNKLSPTEWKLVETRNLVEIFNICTTARENKMFVAISGTEGLGKTESLTAYDRQNPNTYFITCDKGMNPKQIFAQLSTEMGLPNQMPVYELKKQIIKTLNQQTNPLVIIDEVSKIGLPNLTHFQDLWDGMKSNGGLVISGAPHFFERLLKAVNGRKIGMPELYSRISYHHDLKKPTKAEIQAICELNGIVDKESIEAAKVVSNFRILSHYINNKKYGLI
jgi:DNA transposition AAA+ family ATPase